jgi:hypothetical protein
MRVLVVGTEPSSIDQAATRLRAAGHEVVGCHEPGETAFPCAGLDEARGCPLEGTPVDVAVTIRTRPWPRPTPFEDGGKCALRQFVPLVVVGTALHPFESWATCAIDDEDALAEACEEAVRAPLVRHGEVATAALRDVIALAGHDVQDVSATVHRQRGRLLVTALVPDGIDHTLRSNAVAHALTALRKLDPHAGGIDVSAGGITP